MKFLCIILLVTISCDGQRNVSLPLSRDSLRQILRGKITAPEGRSLKLDDIILQHYSSNSTNPTSYRIGDVGRLQTSLGLDLQERTVVYAHGYAEYTTDASVQTIVAAYRRAGRHNVLVVDWANVAFGDYVTVALRVEAAGAAISSAISKLVRGGLPRESLHLVGHSLGVHLLATVARKLAAKGIRIPRLTGLDPAYPGFYPPVLGTPVSPSDAEFVDIIHTDGGGYGTPQETGHVDFWPNGGTAKQPGCLSATIFLTAEDFCSHWRSWAFWAEAVSGGRLWARSCSSYDSFLRGECRGAPLVALGPATSSLSRGNFYLRTAAKEPYSLGERGAD